MPVVNREVVLPVPRERAWELITEPSELEGWLGRRGRVRADRGRAAARHRRRRDPRGRRRGGRRAERIVFRWGDSRVEWALEDHPGGTRFVVTEHRFAADTVTWGPKLMALAGASMLCPA